VGVATGARPIGSLKVGDTVLAYNATTGQTDTEPIQHVWLNHDHDLVDVGLRETNAPPAATSTTTTTAINSTKSPLSTESRAAEHRCFRRGGTGRDSGQRCRSPCTCPGNLRSHHFSRAHRDHPYHFEPSLAHR